MGLSKWCEELNDFFWETNIKTILKLLQKGSNHFPYLFMIKCGSILSIFGFTSGITYYYFIPHIISQGMLLPINHFLWKYFFNQQIRWVQYLNRQDNEYHLKLLCLLENGPLYHISASLNQLVYSLPSKSVSWKLVQKFSHSPLFYSLLEKAKEKDSCPEVYESIVQRIVSQDKVETCLSFLSFAPRILSTEASLKIIELWNNWFLLPPKNPYQWTLLMKIIQNMELKCLERVLWDERMYSVSLTTFLYLMDSLIQPNEELCCFLENVGKCVQNSFVFLPEYQVVRVCKWALEVCNNHDSNDAQKRLGLLCMNLFFEHFRLSKKSLGVFIKQDELELLDNCKLLFLRMQQYEAQLISI